MAKNDSDPLELAKDALKRIQEFDVNKLPQKERLGTALCFDAAVEPARKLVGFYKKIALSALDDFSPAYLVKVKDNATSDYNIFDQILKFNTQNQAQAQRDDLINQIRVRYNQAFNELHQLVSYSMHKATDFEGLEVRARAKLQQIEDRGNNIATDLEGVKEEAEQILDIVRQGAAEQGVTQQAIYFKEEADRYESACKTWLWASGGAAVLLGIYAVVSFWFARWFLTVTDSPYGVIQFVVSKVLLFFVLSYALYFTSRNYFSSKHNAVLNRHRQNAILTYKYIADAASNTANTDIILNHAAMCIYSPQNTGYSTLKQASLSSGTSPLSLLLKHASGEKTE